MTTTTRRKPKPLPGLPAPGTHYVTCAAPGCGRQYPPAGDRPPVELYPGAGDFDSVRWHARGEGWTHDEQIGDICPADEFYPWKPLRLAITAGGTMQPCGRLITECIDDVCRSGDVCAWPPGGAAMAALPHRVTTPALPAPEPGLEPLPEPLSNFKNLPRPGAAASATTGSGPGQPDDTVAFVPPQYAPLADYIAEQDEATGD